MTTPDHTDHTDHDDRSREDWWTALTDSLRADPTRSGPFHEHRARLGRVDRGPDSQVHRGPDGRLYYGCCVPPDAVRIDPADGRALDEPSWDRAADHTSADGDGDGDESGDGW